MYYCPICFAQHRPRVAIVTDEDLEDDILLRDGKAFLRRIAYPRRRYPGWLLTAIEEAKTSLMDEDGNPAFISLETLDKKHYDLWVRDWIKAPLPTVRPRVRAESKERVRLLLTLARMAFPKETSIWGRQGSKMLTLGNCPDAA